MCLKLAKMLSFSHKKNFSAFIVENSVSQLFVSVQCEERRWVQTFCWGHTIERRPKYCHSRKSSTSLQKIFIFFFLMELYKWINKLNFTITTFAVFTWLFLLYLVLCGLAILPQHCKESPYIRKGAWSETLPIAQSPRQL